MTQEAPQRGRRVAIVHSFYRSENPSGENAAVEAEADALRRHGYTVLLVGRSSDQAQDEPLYRLRSAGRVGTGWGHAPLEELEAFAPDVVHVHNLFPNFGHRWVERLRVPLVHTLHNFRPFCASGDHFRDGAPCTLCTANGAHEALRHRCYRDSVLATAPLALRIARGAGRDPVLRRADAVLALTDRMRDALMDAGIDAARIRRWSNFLPAHLDPGAGSRRAVADGRDAGFLYVGRLEPAKGIAQLVEAWPEGARLTIVGGGPDHARVQDAAAGRPDVDLVGSTSRAEVLELMQRARALVLPSRWFEGQPLVYLEALACGLPVLATDPSSVAARVESEGTGRRFVSVSELADAVGAGLDSLPPAVQVRRAFDARYTEQAYLQRVDELYGGLIAAAPRGRVP